MKITVKTLGDSIYEFTQKDGRLFFENEDISGEVVCFLSGPINVGKRISMEFLKDGIPHTRSNYITILNTTLVTKITVIP